MSQAIRYVTSVDAPLFESDRITRRLESAHVRMRQTQQPGEPPASFLVGKPASWL
jgi:hypothetical protein